MTGRRHTAVLLEPLGAARVAQALVFGQGAYKVVHLVRPWQGVFGPEHYNVAPQLVSAH